MSLTVSQINNNNAYNKRKTEVTQKRLLKSSFVDKSCDGKFSASQAGKNFIKGLISPVTNMFSSVKNIAIGVTMMAASMLLVAATGGAIAPLFVIAGLGMGVCQLAKAGYKIATAKNGDDVEKAFYDIGGTTSTVGLSVLGARNSLKQANIKTEGLNTFNTVKKCLTSAKGLITESANVFKSGYYKTNLKTAISVIKNPQSLRKYSEELAGEGHENFESSFNALKDVLPNEFKNSLKGRSKCQVSIYEKMVKERTALVKKIKTIKSDKSIPLSERKSMIKELKTKITNIDTDAKVAKSLVEDDYGARIISSSAEKTDKLVNVLENAVKKGKIEILEIENYRGYNPNYSKSNEFYLNTDQLKKLAKVCKDKNVINKDKMTGYTSIQMKVKPKNAKTLELQIRGNDVNSVANWEHIPYDLRQGKDIAKGNNKLGIMLSKIKKAVAKMNKEQDKSYQKYIYDNYVYAQAKELGKNTKSPRLPKGIDEILSAKSLLKLQSKTSGFESKTIRNPFDVTPQLSVVANVNTNKKEI